MNKETIEEILKTMAAEDMPADVHRIAEEAFENFDRTLAPPKDFVISNTLYYKYDAVLKNCRIFYQKSTFVYFSIFSIPSSMNCQVFSIHVPKTGYDYQNY